MTSCVNRILLICLCNAFIAISANQMPKPNILVIVADDMGWNDVSFHGSRQIPTPNIDALASSGIKLDNYYVSYLCSPTRGALLTGRHPMQLGLQRMVIRGQEPWGLGLNETILPQYLRDMGYATHMVGKWHLGFFAKELTPLYRGFDSFYGYYLGAEDYFDHTAFEDLGDWGMDFRDGFDILWNKTGSYSTELFAARAEKIIGNHDTSKPLFLYLPFQAVHSGNSPITGVNPLQAPKKYVDRFKDIEDPNRRLYAGMVSALDDAIGNITSALEAKGLMDNSIIIFTSDNGGPANGFNFNHASNWPLRGLKATYWEGGMRANGFVWSKLLKQTGRVSNQLMHVTDWLPTLMHAAGADSDYSKAELYGLDMWEVLSNNLPSPREEIVHNYDETTGAIRIGSYKLIVIGKEQSITKLFSDWYKPESVDVSKLNLTVTCAVRDPSLPECSEQTSPCLYDIENDPCEYNNIAHKYPDLVASLTDRLMDFASKSQAPRNCPGQKYASPAYHGDAWVSWISLPANVTDERQCSPPKN